MASHTPAPWTAKRDRRRTAPWRIEDSDGMIAEVLAIGSFGIARPDETEANANLIAAAPDMLAALRGENSEPHCISPLSWLRSMIDDCKDRLGDDREDPDAYAMMIREVEGLYRNGLAAVAKAEGA